MLIVSKLIASLRSAVLSAIAALLLFGAGLAPYALRAQPPPSLASQLAEAQRLLAAGKIPEGLAALDRAAVAAKLVESQNLGLQEDIRWQAAMSNLDFAQQLENPRQHKHYATQARRLWKEYIEWFDGLTPAQRQQLGPGHTRINSAVGHLGNAGVRMGDYWAVLTDYSNLSSVEDFGTDAFTLWKTVLYRCPDWRPIEDRSTALRQKKICDESCKGEWLAYADTLSEWTSGHNLRPAARQAYERETAQIKDTANACGRP